MHAGQPGERVAQQGAFGDGLAQLHVDGVAAELALQLVGGALDDDPAAVHDRDPLAEPVGLFEVVGGQHYGEPLVAGEAGDLVPHRGAGLGVEAGGGLVEEQDLGAVHQAERHVEAALHAARVALDDALGGVAEAEPFEQLVDAAIEGRAGQPVQAPLELEVLAAGGDGVGAGLLRHHADRAPDPVGVAQHVVPGDGRGAAVGAGEGGEDLDGGGFAGAVGAEQSEGLAGFDGDGHAVEGGDITGVGLDQVVRLYCGRPGAHDGALLW